jgi:DNA-binding protein HU-beta
LFLKSPWYIIPILLLRNAFPKRSNIIQHSYSQFSEKKSEKRKSMNKQALVEWVHEKIGGTKVQAEEVVNGMFEAIVATLRKGGEVSIAGIGIFSVKPRAARMARNPKTGEQVKVAATKVPKFRAAKALKDAVK